jgi:hypothetical protein
VAGGGGEADTSAREADAGVGEQAKLRGGASNRGRRWRPEHGQGRARRHAEQEPPVALRSGGSGTLSGRLAAAARAW